MRLMRTSGVSPIRSRIESTLHGTIANPLVSLPDCCLGLTTIFAFFRYMKSNSARRLCGSLH